MRMKHLSLRTKITLWYSAALLLVVIMAFCMVVAVSYTVLQRGVSDDLIYTVESNVDEVEYYATLETVFQDGDNDHYIHYADGYLEIDDDYLDLVNGYYTALYHESGELLYGENPLSGGNDLPTFEDSVVRHEHINGTIYYIYDRQLTGSKLSGLWLRGVVSEKQGETQLFEIARLSLICLLLLLVVAILGGYWIAGRSLRPLHRVIDAMIRIEHGNDLGMRVECVRGSSELHKLSESFNNMLCRLESAFLAEHQFTADASHELRTPMAVILAQCEYLTEDVHEPQEYLEGLRVIQRQGDRASALIAAMLELTRLENANGYAREQVDFSRLAEEVCAELKLLKEKNIMLDWHVQPDVRMEANEALLSRMLINLVRNAYCYGKENGHIHVRLRKDEKQVLLEVEDDGIGIAAEHRERIFNRFFQVNVSRNAGSFGFGLSMVKQIAEMYEGRVEVDSTPEQGSTFRIIFLQRADF